MELILYLFESNHARGSIEGKRATKKSCKNQCIRKKVATQDHAHAYTYNTYIKNIQTHYYQYIHIFVYIILMSRKGHISGQQCMQGKEQEEDEACDQEHEERAAKPKRNERGREKRRKTGHLEKNKMNAKWEARDYTETH